MKEKIELIKKLWIVPRYRSLIILGLYIIFFGSIIAYSNTAKKVEHNQIKQTKIVQNNYNFELTFNDKNLKGSKENDIITFENGEVIDLKSIDSNYIYKDVIKYFDLKYLYNILDNEKYFSKTEYNDLSISKNYKLDEEEITIYEKNDEIYKFELIKDQNTYVVSLLFD